MRFQVSSENDARDALYLLSHELELQHIPKVQISEFVTLASELIFNVLRHGREGEVEFTIDANNAHLTVSDQGKGFKRLGEYAFKEGVSSSNGLGLGLSASVRMADEFSLETSDEGTRVEVCKRIKND